MNNLSFRWNCWIRCGEIYVICVALIFFIAFLLFSTISRYFPHVCILLLPVNTCCCSCGRCFSFCLYGLFRRMGDYRTLLPLFPSLVKWACAACNRRKIQCLLCRSCLRACSTRCYRSSVALHRSLVPVISWLSSPAPWITYCLGDLCRSF